MFFRFNRHVGGFAQPRRSAHTLGLVAVAAAAWFGCIAPSHAGIFDDSEARQAVLDLRTRVSALETQVSAAQRAELDQATQIEQLNQQIADLRGQNELLSQKAEQMQSSAKDYYANLHGRVNKLESPAPSTAKADKASDEDGEEDSDVVPRTASPEQTEAFNQALVRFRHGDFKGAELAFKQFIQKYPQAVDQPHAQYWLGNALYAQRKYAASTSVLLGVAKNYPTHPRAPEALLAVAQNHMEQKQNKPARETLQRLIKQYPHSASAKTAQKWIKQVH